MKDPRRWLDARRPVPPGSLRTALTRALESAGDTAPSTGSSVAERLADAGLATLRSVLAGDAGRTSAPALLAADALLTYACEAAAEEGPAAVARLGERLSPQAFEALLESGS